MEPTLVDGDQVLVDPKAKLTEGAMIVATHPHDGHEIVKRLQSWSSNGLWLLSDNSSEGSDSRRFGAVDPETCSGVVTLILNRPFNSVDRFR